jgi:flagellar motor switch protein FliM
MSYQSVLSQDEVDALLAGVTGEQEAGTPEKDENTSGVRAYDLTSPDRVVRHRMQTLELINERFARRLRAALFSFTRRNADITVNTLRIVKYSEFERNLPVPSNLNMVALKPLRGTALFSYDPNLVFAVIDTVFGGHGRYNTRVEGRDFTNTEQRIIRRLLNITLDGYSNAWEQIYKIDLEYIRSEMHTKFASITGNHEIVVVSTFNIELGSTGGRLNICLPYSMIEPLRDLLSRPLNDSSQDSTDQLWTNRLSKQMRSAGLELVAEFARIDSTIGELMRLQVGDVLPIDVPKVITAHVGGVPIMECQYGTSKNRYALRVNTLLTNAETDFS